MDTSEFPSMRCPFAGTCANGTMRGASALLLAGIQRDGLLSGQTCAGTRQFVRLRSGSE